jgi:lambda repressor-like predicted transcriptional regulator
MPRPGQAFPITDEWREAVTAEMRRQGIGRSELARRASLGRSTVSDILNGRTKQSPVLPDIHVALGWPPPMPPIPSKDGPELSAIYERLDDANRIALLERALTLLEIQRKRG